MLKVTKQHDSSVLMVRCDSIQEVKNVGDHSSNVSSCDVWRVVDNTNDIVGRCSGHTVGAEQ